MKLVFASFFLLHCFCNLFCQQIQIIDKETQKGIPFVSIYNSDKTRSALTNEDGFFKLDLFNKIDTLVFRSLGYSSTVSLFITAKENKKIYLERNAFNLDAVQVSALRWRLNPNDIPNKIFSISKKDVFIQQPQTAADLLSVSNKVFVQKSQMGGGSPMIRGFSSNRLLYSVDGVRMNTAIFRSGNVHNVISLDPYSIEESEIMLGPGSVLYGSDALGGVLRFETLKPKFKSDSTRKVSGNVASRFSSANAEKTIHLDLNVAMEKWAFLSSLTLTDYNHLEMGKHGPREFLQDTFAVNFQGQDALAISKNNRKQIKTAYHQKNFMQKIANNLDSNNYLEYAFHFSETSDIPRYDRLIQKRNGNLRFAEWYYGPQKWIMHQLSWNSKKNRKWFNEIYIDAAFQNFKESRNSRRFFSDELNITEEKVNAYSVNVDFIKSLNTKHKLTYGIESVINTVNSRGKVKNIKTNTTITATSRYPNANWFSNALYINDIFKINEHTSLNFGFRLNHFSLNAEFDTTLFPYPETKTSLDFLSLTGSIGINRQLSKKSLLSLLISNGFRAPNVDDIGKVFDSEPGSVVVPNSSLSSEKVYNFELSIKQSINAKLLLDVATYYSILSDAMLRRNSTYQGNDSILFQGELSQVQSIQNATSAYIYGFNFGAQYLVTKKFKVRGNYNFQTGEESINGSNSPIRHVSPNFGNFEFTYTHKRFEVVFDYQFSEGFQFDELNTGEQNKPHLYAIDSQGRPYSPSWYTLNLGLSYKTKTSLNLFLGVDNISNQRYKTYSSGIAAAGRNIIASMNYKF